MAKLLLLNSPCVREARKHEALIGRRLLGSGQFSGVYESENPNSVLKLSVDHSWHELVTRWVPDGHASLPAVVCDHGVVGHAIIGSNLSKPKPKEVPLFLVEVERLEKLDVKSENYRMARHISKIAQRAYYKGPSGADVGERAENIIGRIYESPYVPQSIRDALAVLLMFCTNYGDAFLDLHAANFMQRPISGELILSDPVACYSAFNQHI